MYYLQSRYYNPTLGRFINADVAVATGQGLIGNNTFAYCLNNPVNGCDPCGTCFHRWDFWNDCEKCGGKTFGEKLGEYAADVYDMYMMQNEWQRQVDETNFDSMRDSATAMWDAYEYSIEYEAQKQYNQDMEVRAQWEDTFRSPARAGDFIVMTISNVSAYTSYYAVASAASVTFTGGLALGITIGCAIWSTLRYYEIIDE